LSDFVEIKQDQKTKSIAIVFKYKGQPYYRLNGMLLGEYINYIDATVLSKPADKASGETFRGIMGLFERTGSDLFLKDGVYSLWSRDVANPVEDNIGKAPGKNNYGTHPFYMGRTRHESGSWFGVFTNLAAAQDWWIKNDSEGIVDVKTIAAGGVGDLYFMTGEGPNEVTKMYHSIIGTPVLVPQWALGWNQCRWGYNKLSDVEEVVENYKKHNLPLDVQWSDIDYMQDYRDFTYDKVNYKGLPGFVKKLH